MTGDAEKIDRLYREMIGEEIEEDLSHVWPVQLGEATEQLNLDWMERERLELSRRGEVVVHPVHTSGRQRRSTHGASNSSAPSRPSMSAGASRWRW